MTLSTLLLATATSFGTLPTPAHLEYHEREIMGLIHWGPNTFTDQEWGFGNASPDLVKPTNLDPEQWVKSMKAGGIKRIVLICKHHDGFCLWPSPLNKDYSMSAVPAPYKGFDIVKATEEACKKHDVKFGAYLSPWDRHQANYSTPEYVEYYHAQWDDLMANYGEISEIWLDGANGGTGWYGGVNGDKGERRSIKKGYYDFPRLLEKLHKKHPMAIAFGGEGNWSSIWCGNERGYSPETWWNPRKVEDGNEYWTPSEADTPLRTGWFYHEHEKPKSLKKLVDIYFASVGRGAILNLGIAPDKKGLVCDDDVARLKEFGDYVRAFNATDFATSTPRVRRLETMSETSGQSTIVFPKAINFNCVDIREQIKEGQRIESYTVSVRKNGLWQEVEKGTTIGARRLVRFESVLSDAVRVTFKSRAKPKLHPIAVRFAPVVKEEANATYAIHPNQSWEVLSEKDGLTVDCGMPLLISGFDYIPPSKDCKHGIIDEYTFEVSNDAKSWKMVKKGEFGNLAANPVRTRIVFDNSVTAKYIRFTAKHRLTDGEGYCLKEIALFE